MDAAELRYRSALVQVVSPMQRTARRPASTCSFVTDVSCGILDRLRALDLSRCFEVRKKHLLGLAPDRRVFDDGVELVVDRDTEQVEIGRADAEPAAVHDA